MRQGGVNRLVSRAGLGLLLAASFAMKAAGEPAEWPQAAFQAKTVSAATRALYGTEVAAPSKGLRLGTDNPVSRDHIPVELSADDAFDAASLFISGSRTPLAVAFVLGPRTLPTVATRLSAPRNTDIVAIVRSSGKLLRTECAARATHPGASQSRDRAVLKAHMRDGIVRVRALIIDSADPARSLRFEQDGTLLLSADFGSWLATPERYVDFRVKGAGTGAPVRLVWIAASGVSRQVAVPIQGLPDAGGKGKDKGAGLTAAADPYRLDIRGIRLGMTLDEVMAQLPDATIRPHEVNLYDRHSPRVISLYQVEPHGNTALDNWHIVLTRDKRVYSVKSSQRLKLGGSWKDVKDAVWEKLHAKFGTPTQRRHYEDRPDLWYADLGKPYYEQAYLSGTFYGGTITLELFDPSLDKWNTEQLRKDERAWRNQRTREDKRKLRDNLNL